MFQGGLLYYLRLTSGQSGRWCRSSMKRPEKKNEKTFSRNIHMRSHIPDVLGPGFGKLVSIVNLCFLGVNYASATRQRILTKIRACEQFQKICTSQWTHVQYLRAIRETAKFCEHFQLNRTIFLDFSIPEVVQKSNFRAETRWAAN